MYVCVYGSVYNSPCLWEGCVCLCTGSSCVGVGYCFQREDFVVGCSVCSAGRSLGFSMSMFVSGICDQTSNISDYGVEV